MTPKGSIVLTIFTLLVSFLYLVLVLIIIKDQSNFCFKPQPLFNETMLHSLQGRVLNQEQTSNMQPNLRTSTTTTSTEETTLPTDNNLKVNFASKEDSYSLTSNSSELCHDLMNEQMTDATVMEFYRACVQNIDTDSINLGSGLFKEMFSAKIFEGTVCEEKERSYISGQDLVALASFPGSGNTWARILLEQMTGSFYRSILSSLQNL